MTTELIILVTGDRNWTDYKLIYDILKPYKNVTLIHGACRGVDMMCDKAAKELCFNIISKPADWNKYGKAAGPMRNTEMVKQLVEYKSNGKETIVLAFHDDLTNSKGTRNCISQALKYKLKVILHSHEDKIELTQDILKEQY